MTKNFKLVLALALAAMMIVSMVSAFAAAVDPSANYTLTITNNGNLVAADHTFEAYQIFTGDLSDDQTKLSNIGWGSGVKSTDLVAALVAEAAKNDSPLKTELTGLTSTSDAVAVAEAFGKIGTDAAKAKALARIISKHVSTTTSGTYASGKITGLSAGYYFVQDTTTITDPDSDAVSAFMLQIVKDVSVAIKADAPTVTKKIIDEDGATRVDKNTASLHDDVSYEIESAIPDHTNYDWYYFVVNDKLSKGLTFNNDIKVYKQVKKDDGIYEAEVEMTATEYKVYTDDSNYTFQVALLDAKAIPVGTKIFVRYSAKVNENAVIGKEGNPNEVDLIYSNNPNKDGRGDKDNDHPGIPKESEDTSTGTTPKDYVITYTAEIDILKTKNGTTEPLAGAEFTLTGTSKKAVLNSKEVYTEGTGAEAKWYRMTNGTWSDEEPTVDRMVKLNAGATAGYVEDATYTGSDRKIVDSKVYRPYKAADDAGKDVFEFVKGNSKDYASTEKKYVKGTATKITYQTYPVKMVATSDSEGKLSFSKLGAGTYTIEETVVPDGYNKAENVKVVINVKYPDNILTGKEKATWSANGSTANVVVREEDEGGTKVATVGIYDVTINNNSGAVLPTTGGIGTTIFYVAGSLMVLAAAILLITKRRMGAND